MVPIVRLIISAVYVLLFEQGRRFSEPNMYLANVPNPNPGDYVGPIIFC